MSSIEMPIAKLNSENCISFIDEKLYKVKKKKSLAIIAEALASYIARKMSNNVLPYRIIKMGCDYATICERFDREQIFMSMKEYCKLLNNETSRLALQGNLTAIYQILSDDFSELKELFFEMVLSDMLVLNSDRCPRNYGFILDNTSSNANFVPFFDYDYSLYNSEYSILLLDETECRPFCES
jgi:hypothetical protein